MDVYFFPSCISILIKSATFIIEFCIYRNKSTFSTMKTVISIVTGNVKKFAVYIITIIELEFKSEHLFRSCSIATNPVMPLEFNPIR